MAEKGMSGMTKEEISALSEKIGGAAFALLVSIPFVGPQLLETAGKAAEMADAASASLGWGAAGRIGMESAGAATAAVLIVASNALVAKAAAALRARRKGPVADAASRGCLFEMRLFGLSCGLG